MFNRDILRTLKLPEAVAKLQKVSNPLYDQLDIPSAGKYIFFKGSQGRSRLFTNFDPQSALDNPRHYLVAGIRVMPAASTPAADVEALSQRSYFTFLVGDKPFFEAPLSLLMAKAGALLEQGEHGRAFYTLDHPILLPPQQIFRPSIDVESPVTLSAPVAVTLAFEGVLMRPAQ
jgi:hypothetical protein